MTFETQQIEQLVLLRVAVGFLGEQTESKWWSSGLCGTGGKAFLAPIFPRTHLLAQFEGVTSSAAIVHDDHIGLGETFHLFRLPEDLEQSLHFLAGTSAESSIADVTASADFALNFLIDYSGDSRKQAVGPVKIGDLSSLRSADVWKKVAAYYLGGFEQTNEVFPFFSNTK